MEKSPTAVRMIILQEIRDIAAQQDRILAKLVDNLPLVESGLDSLCIAVLVASLEDRLGLDPFSDARDAVFPVTLGEFITLYKNAAV